MKFFIYGTLKQHQNNHNVLERLQAKFISKDTSTLKYPMFNLSHGFPYLQDTPNIGNIIYGEVYEINPKFEKDLDEFEGVPELYKKGSIETKLNGLVNCYFITNELLEKEIINTKLLNIYKGN